MPKKKRVTMPKKKQRKLVTSKRMKRKHKYYQVTRDYRGRFLKFEKWIPKIKTMHRLTLAINYYVHHKYYSYKVQAWHRKKSTLNRRSEPLEKELKEKLEKRLGYPESDFWFDVRIGKEFEKVPFDSRLVGTEEFTDELLYEKVFKEGKWRKKK
jgi:hypothetical protein